jgi:peptide deformylase
MFEIVKYPNAILKRSCLRITVVGEEEKDILRRMAKTMYLNRGVGLAGPQVGINKQLAVVDIGDGKLIKLINPVVIDSKRTELMEEGCLSIPNVYIRIKRAKWIRVKLLDEKGQEFTLEASGLLARAILHEIDHLKGKLIIDYLNPLKRFLTLRRRG